MLFKNGYGRVGTWMKKLDGFQYKDKVKPCNKRKRNLSVDDFINQNADVVDHLTPPLKKRMEDINTSPGEDQMVHLTEEMNNLIAASISGPLEHRLTVKFKLQITRKDFNTFRCMNWI